MFQTRGRRRADVRPLAGRAPESGDNREEWAMRDSNHPRFSRRKPHLATKAARIPAHLSHWL